MCHSFLASFALSGFTFNASRISITLLATGLAMYILDSPHDYCSYHLERASRSTAVFHASRCPF